MNASPVRKWLRTESLRLAFDPVRKARTTRLLAVSGILFALILLLRFITPGIDQLALLLCVVPISLVAIALGTVGGLAAAAFSYSLFILWVILSGTVATPLDHLARAVSFFFVGGLVGYFTTQGRKLEEQDSRWFELSLDIAGTAGFDGYFKRVNPTFERTLGYTEAELLKRPLEEFVHPDDRASTIVAAARLGAGLDVVGFQNRYRAKDGSYHWMEWSCTSVTSEQLIYAAAKDITERKESEEKLLVAEERFRTAFESAPIGIALVDLEGHWLQANAALCRLTGYSLDEILKVGFRDITHPDDRAADELAIAKLRDGSITSYRLEKRFIHSKGYPVWVSFNCSLVSLPGGPPLYLITQVEDISRRKELEEQLRHMAQHDPLTGLFNRRRFDEELGRRLGTSTRYRASGALFILDLDNFKAVNDTRGHAAGDEVLKAVAEVLKKHLRSTDIAARLGGDEFAVLLGDGSRRGAQTVAHALLRMVRQASGSPDEVLAPVRLSIGITLFGVRGSVSQETLVQQADSAMYSSKRRGGDRYTFSAETERDVPPFSTGKPALRLVSR